MVIEVVITDALEDPEILKEGFSLKDQKQSSQSAFYATIVASNHKKLHW